MRPRRPKQVISWFVIVAAFFGAVGWIFAANESFYRDHASYFSGLSSPPIASLRPSSVRVEIHFLNGTKRAFRGAAAEGLTALAALRASGEAGRFPVRTDERGQILEIARLRSTPLRRWVLTVNGVRQSELAGHIELRGGDRVVFRYE